MHERVYIFFLHYLRSVFQCSIFLFVCVHVFMLVVCTFFSVHSLSFFLFFVLCRVYIVCVFFFSSFWLSWRLVFQLFLYLFALLYFINNSIRWCRSYLCSLGNVCVCVFAVLFSKRPSVNVTNYFRICWNSIHFSVEFYVNRNEVLTIIKPGQSLLNAF